MNPFIKHKVKLQIEELERFSEKIIYEIPEFSYTECGYKNKQEKPDIKQLTKKLTRDGRIRGFDDHFWLYTEFETPELENENEHLEFELVAGQDGTGDVDGTNPQGLLYLNDEMVCGMDVNHRSVKLQPNTKYRVLIYFYIGRTDTFVYIRGNLKTVRDRVKQLYYDMVVPYETSMCFEEDNYEHIKTLKILEQTCNIIDMRVLGSDDFYQSIADARKFLKDEFYDGICGNSDAVVNYIGHTHIDTAWLWTLAQTREKVQRSFSTVLHLMEEYPEYIFMSSQPQLYEFLKQEAPEAYEKVKQRINEGRWEAEGAMWVEADCNLSSGESLIRQIMHGKRFMKEEFGVDNKILWLPDVFGYSSSLPQILKKTGVEKFVTSKISWCERNKIPYDTFMWEGIDGTEILTYFITCQTHEEYLKDITFTTYIGTGSPSMTLGTWERYQQKELNNETLVTFGYGDGGGGPTADMLERIRRLEYGLPGIPKAQISRVGDFLDRVEENFKTNCKNLRKTPKWVGELYLEYHRGTYTSTAKIKRNNRKAEFLCLDAETASVIEGQLCGGEYPARTLYDSWQTVLLNQFHDIIPGSSIQAVYDDSEKQYAELNKNVGDILSDKINKLADNVCQDGIFVYNPNSFKASGYTEYNGDIIYADDVPPMGYKVIKNVPEISDVKVSDYGIESKYYSIKFDDNMNITSLFDKANKREAVKAGDVMNRLSAYEDYPTMYDNWEISEYYKQKEYPIDNVTKKTIIGGNGWGGFEIERVYNNSTINQRIMVYENSRRIDFVTNIDWKEHHVLVKAAFPVNVHANKATYETQFGNVERPTHENTSWDMAKFEVCAHKWGDISEEDYGVSILNDCKYGYGASGSTMTISFLKCGTFPNPEGDQGMHTFTYSIYPHKGGFKRGGTINESYLLNRPLKALSSNGQGSLPKEFSYVSCDAENVIIETIKRSEDKMGDIVRLYDAWDMKSTPTLAFAKNIKNAYLCNMLEETEEELQHDKNTVTVNVSNFEIVTIKVEFEN